MEKVYSLPVGEFREEYTEKAKPNYRRGRDGSHTTVSLPERTVVREGIRHQFTLNYGGNSILVVYEEGINGSKSSVIVPGRLLSGGKESTLVDTITDNAEKEGIRRILSNRQALKGLPVNFWP